MADPVDDLLRRWAQAQAGRHAYVEEREAPDVHTIARSLRFAPKTRARAAVKLAGRDGSGRRRMMAEAAGVVGMWIVPMSFCDPIPCRESRHSGPTARVDEGIPPELRLVDRAMMDLYRQDTFRGLCVRMEYTKAGYQSDKARAVGLALGSPVTLRQYRDGLRLGREWMRGRIAA